MVLGIAERNRHPISFWEFTTYGLVVMVATVALSALYLWLRYFALAWISFRRRASRGAGRRSRRSGGVAVHGVGRVGGGEGVDAFQPVGERPNAQRQAASVETHPLSK